ncbi:hypothetical protein ACLKA6_019339 [Drosophila palustris]
MLMPAKDVKSSKVTTKPQKGFTASTKLGQQNEAGREAGLGKGLRVEDIGASGSCSSGPQKPVKGPAAFLHSQCIDLEPCLNRA